MKVKIVCSILIVLFIVSCKKKTEDTSIKVTENIINNLEFSKIGNIEKVIPINLDSLKIFSDINNIFLKEDNIIIHSKNPSMISLLDQSGKVLNQVQPDTTNPFLIDGITEIKILDEYIFVLDREHFSIYKLNMDFKVESKIKIPFYAQSFLPLGEETYLLYTGHEITENNKGMFVYYNSNTNQILKDLLPIHKNTPNFLKFLTTNHISMNMNGVIHFWDSSKTVSYTHLTLPTTPYV